MRRSWPERWKLLSSLLSGRGPWFHSSELLSCCLAGTAELFLDVKKIAELGGCKIEVQPCY